MNHLFVPYELAAKLKEKGFDEECFKAYRNSDGEEYLMSLGIWRNGSPHDNHPEFAAAPLYQQVVEWLRVVHGINILPIENYRYPDSIMERWKYQIVNKQEKDRDIFNKKFYIESDFEFNSPQETYSAAFDYILNNNLI